MANRIGGVALATAVASGFSPDRPAALGTAKYLWIHVKPYILFLSYELACVSQARLRRRYRPYTREKLKHLGIANIAGTTIYILRSLIKSSKD